MNKKTTAIPISLTIQSSFALTLLGVLIFIYSIPGTIALRNFLLAAGLICSLPGYQLRQITRPLRLVALVWLMLTAWLILQAIVFSSYPADAVRNLCGDWLRGALAAVFSVSTFCLLTRDIGFAKALASSFAAATLALGAHPFFYLLDQLWIWHQTGTMPFQYHESWVGGRDFVSEVTNACFCLLCGDLLSRSLLHKPLVSLPAWIRAALVVISLAATFTLSTSLGTVTLIAVLVVVLAILATQLRPRRTKVLLAVFVALLAGVIALANDKRTHHFLETVPLAQDVDKYAYIWLYQTTNKLPPTASGRPAELSTFLRLTYAHAALREIADRPQGFGYGHRAFGFAVNQRYGTHFDYQSAHSGWLDFTLGGGIPALLLWLIFSALLLRQGWRSGLVEGNPAGFALILYVFNYLIRCAIDNHMSGLRFEEYLMLAALLAAAASVPRNRTIGDNRSAT